MSDAIKNMRDDIKYFEKKIRAGLGLDKFSDEEIASVTHEMRAADKEYRTRLGLLREALLVYVKTRLLKKPLGY